MPRVLGGSYGGGRFLMGEVPLSSVASLISSREKIPQLVNVLPNFQLWALVHSSRAFKSPLKVYKHCVKTQVKFTHTDRERRARFVAPTPPPLRAPNLKRAATLQNVRPRLQSTRPNVCLGLMWNQGKATATRTERSVGYGGHGVYGVGVRESERERERERHTHTHTHTHTRLTAC